ncbi:MAG TPA: WYL domain-containing protein [Caldisericia bacterium]|nr:WYL domain-containing protein [Caldisericia bacterium]
MSNIHRIRWIDQQIRNRAYPNCKTIAEQFEISIRQASRDIEYLRYSLDAPLEYCHEHQGYCYQEDAFALPSLFITKEDRKVLSYLAGQYRMNSSDQALRLAELLQKISGELEGEAALSWPVPELPLHPSLVKKYHLLDRAMKEKTKVHMKYFSNSNDITTRTIHPYQWLQSFGNLYLIAFCEKRKDTRMFRLDRIRKLQALSETYVVASDFNSKRFRDISSRRLCQPYQAIIQWDRAIVLPMSSAFQSKTLPNHTHEVQFESSKQLFSSLLSLAEPFKIISPPWLKDQYDRFLRLFSEKNA